MRVEQFHAKNQFIIYGDDYSTTFQSYNSIIAVKKPYRKVLLGKNWNYSKTTGKYRNMFLGESITETRKKIESGEYVIDNDL